jgi:hypothetical protein
MYHRTLDDAPDDFRRPGTAKRTRTLAPVVPSQDVTRYQASDAPRPTYDLDPPDGSESPILLRILGGAVVATAVAIALIKLVGAWLTR